MALPLHRAQCLANHATCSLASKQLRSYSSSPLPRARTRPCPRILYTSSSTRGSSLISLFSTLVGGANQLPRTPSAERVHAWLSRNLPDRPHPDIKRPFNWMRWGSAITIVLGLGTLLATASPYILPIVQNRNVWAAVSLISILLFISGHMFNHIRRVPYVAGDGRGGITYFSGNFQSQLGMETQIIAAICMFQATTQCALSICIDTDSCLPTDGLLAFCAIALIVKVPRIADSGTQQVAVIAWSVVLFSMYSFMLSIFRIKNNGYPFSLPPFM